MSDSAPAASATVLPKDAAAEKGLVNVQIDGVWIQVPKGTRMIEACKIAEQEVPHYCYHPKLSSPGNCRMCLVQMGMPPRLAPGQEPEYNDEGYQDIGWMPRPVIACANTVAENMGIRTRGELVEKCREGVMEFLLINHPLDCPICDQAGECRLQEFSVEHGVGTSRFKEDKIKKPKNVDIGPRIRLDDERCIMCSRCIRFMDEVAGDPVLGFSQRGTHTSVTVHPGRRLDNNYSLNTADICPVGALTSNDFRFQMRVWFLKETPTIDTNCGTGINTVVWTRGNQIFRVTPRQNDDVNSCWMPDSHRLNFHHVDADDRLTQPMVKAGDQHVDTDWEDALATAQEALSGLSGDQVAIIGSGSYTNEELFLLKTLAETVNTDNLTLVPHTGEADGKLISEDRNANTEGAKLILGRDPYTSLARVRDAVKSGSIKALIVLHEDLYGDAGFKKGDLDQVDTVILGHTAANAAAADATLVLPLSVPFEKRGTLINTTGRIQRLNAAVIAPAEARDDWEVLRDLTLSLMDAPPAITSPEYPHLLEDVFRALTDAYEPLAGLTYSKVGATGKAIIDSGVTIPLIEAEKQRVQNREIVG